MNIDERLDRLTERHEALAESVEMLTAQINALTTDINAQRRKMEDLMASIVGLDQKGENRE